MFLFTTLCNVQRIFKFSRVFEANSFTVRENLHQLMWKINKLSFRFCDDVKLATDIDSYLKGKLKVLFLHWNLKLFIKLNINILSIFFINWSSFTQNWKTWLMNITLKLLQIWLNWRFYQECQNNKNRTNNDLEDR